MATTVLRDDVISEAVSHAVDEILNEPSYQSRATDVAATLTTRSPAQAADAFIEQL